MDRYYKKRKSFDQIKPVFDTKKIARTLDIRDCIQRYVNCGGKVLDVGCGRGEFLVSLKEAGFDVLGVEPDSQLASFVNRSYGIQVFGSMYQSSLFSPVSFDAITFIQVLEHLENPLDVLSTAHMHLKSQGVLVIDVPSFNNPRILAYRMIRWKRLVRKDFIPSHCYYYTRRTLSNLVKKAGFQVFRVETGRYGVKSGINNFVMKWIDKITNVLGIGGITLYATKP